MTHRASVQTAHIHLDAIEDDVVAIAPDQYRAVLEVGSLNFRLLADGEQEAVAASFAAFLNSLTFPVQAMVRVLPLDLEPYLQEIERRAVHQAGALAELAQDHVAYLRRLARNRTLLERRFYLVVPAQGSESAPRPRLPSAVGRPPAWRSTRRESSSPSAAKRSSRSSVAAGWRSAASARGSWPSCSTPAGVPTSRGSSDWDGS